MLNTFLPLILLRTFMKNSTFCKLVHRTIHASCLCMANFVFYCSLDWAWGTVDWAWKTKRFFLANPDLIPRNVFYLFIIYLLYFIYLIIYLFCFSVSVLSWMSADHNQATTNSTSLFVSNFFKRKLLSFVC